MAGVGPSDATCDGFDAVTARKQKIGHAPGTFVAKKRRRAHTDVTGEESGELGSRDRGLVSENIHGPYAIEIVHEQRDCVAYGGVTWRLLGDGSREDIEQVHGHNKAAKFR